ncbi:MAG TPA: excalibur calcium-binding domain-containing protein [Rhodocyclaceae bacterium]|nr:excalibur calcium-binding domain-containing protein [Rhodocyclaceae bacterium]HMV22346.1 excalibur calcium-binding domain-containing protein [Rhodocyclaceae bacterium]HMW77914.1 excalibur calcium-binding domain-containing protein [Rhodocyclaceae bacterium]HNE44117.1 excalibur calcium-binding domain-containing protein [Rhodocyclaceae bacterium]HNM21860.1 excalibur calcium-binding domain-containing protein [Rhodocyclaceae bacterium]
MSPLASVAGERSPTATREPASTASYRCDGRTHCSQMTSCEEATWFLKNCSGTKMDGNNDGIPCEKQWCK